jgi:sarcosine/dimethylglycine N-methyltransferase
LTSVRELYELWAGDSALDEELARSLEPRGTDWLFELFASLGPEPRQLVVDVGARDARHAIRLVREHDLRAVAFDPLPRHVELAQEAVAASGLEIEVAEATIEAMPLPDAAADWIWCRDVLVHVDVGRGLTECARVLRPGGTMVVYTTLATDLLEPRERAELAGALALTTIDGDRVEAAATAAGLELVRKDELAGEWRERMLEDGDWDAGETLLRLSRLRRRRDELVAEFGPAAVDAWVGGHLWGVYQLLGKLCPTVWVWRRP